MQFVSRVELFAGHLNLERPSAIRANIQSPGAYVLYLGK